MGDHREILVDVETPPSSAPASADATFRWLVVSGWADSDSPLDDWLHADVAGYALGLRAKELFPTLGGGTVVVIEKRDGYGLGDGTTEPSCPRCTTVAPADEADEAFVAWWEGTEPTLTCRRCAFSAPIGDWDLSESIAVGEVAVVVDPDASSVDPSALAGALIRELRESSGRRWAYTHLHL